MASIQPELRGALPPQLKFKEIADKITTTRDINKQIQRLSRYRQKGGGFELTNLGGRLITQAELADIQDIVKAENKRRRALFKKVMATQQQQGRFRTSATEDLQQITPESYQRMSPETRAILRDLAFYQKTVNPRVVQYQNNYIRHIENALAIATVSGRVTEEVEAAAREIIDIVSKLDPATFELAYRENAELNISIIGSPPDEEIFLNSITEILAKWRRYG